MARHLICSGVNFLSRDGHVCVVAPCEVVCMNDVGNTHYSCSPQINSVVQLCIKLHQSTTAIDV